MASIKGTLHNYKSRLVAFEFAVTSAVPHLNVVLFVGGLGDGLFTVPYLPALATELDKHGWGTAQV